MSLPDHLVVNDVERSEPRYVVIPAGRDPLEQAVHLRSLGLSYQAIRTVLSAYHGLRMSESTLRRHCRMRGAVAKPRGIPIKLQLQRRRAVSP